METSMVWRRVGGWAAIAVLLLWLLAFGTSIVLGTQVFPGYADRFIPELIRVNLIVATLDGTIQLLLGVALVALALGVSSTLAASSTPLAQFGLLAGLIGGVFMVAAGAVLQENVFTVIFPTVEQNTQLATAMGVPDVTVLTAANALVAGGLRSTAAFGSGCAMVLWSVLAWKTRQLPTVLNGIGILTGVLFALTVWIGPLTGPFAFLGILIWHGWLGFRLIRSSRTPTMPATRPVHT